jgi:RES domain-containing protein
MVSAWRITKRKRARSAFTGEGARLYGGRWNSPGTAIIYTAESQSLAVLEILVHLDSPELLKKYALFRVGIDESYIVDIDAAILPRNWRTEPVPGKVQKIGDEWVTNATSAVLRVPSTLVPGEFNFLLNPRHADFPKLQFSGPIPFHLDPRLTERR